eukprot:scaffold2937_cov137-Skeletonema_menzelii.AAC.5
MYFATTSDNHTLGSDAKRRFHGHLRQLPFERSSKVTATTSSLKHHQKESQPPNSSQLSSRKAFSKGINLNRLQPPLSRRRMSQNTQASPHQSSPYGVGVYEVVSLQSPHAPERSLEDAATATSQLRKLCMDIVQSAKEGTSPPPRARIKESVAEYHQGHHNPISPRDPNFTEIPSEFSQVLTYGLARSQSVQVQQTTLTTEEARKEPSRQTFRRATPTTEETEQEPRRSRFSEIKDEGHFLNELELGPSDLVSCVTLPATIDHGLD